MGILNIINGSDDENLYISKRYPEETFTNLSTNFNSVKNKILRDFPNEKFVDTLLTYLRDKGSGPTASPAYLTGVYDIIYSQNSISNMGAIIPRNKDTMAAYYYKASGNSKLVSDQISIWYNPENDTYSGHSDESDITVLGQISRGYENAIFNGFNERRELYLFPAYHSKYGSFEGIYELPYSMRENGLEGVATSDVFMVENDTYYVAFSDHGHRAEYIDTFNMFIYKLNV